MAELPNLQTSLSTVRTAALKEPPGLDMLQILLDQSRPPTLDPLGDWEELTRAHLEDVRRPVIETAELAASGFSSVPSLSELYISPAYRVVEAGQSTPIFDNGWWESARVIREDVHEFLAGYFTLPSATESPLVILGDPGAGKSALTRALSAQLSGFDFCPVRVELRYAPADGDILDHIEFGLRRALQRSVTWASLAQDSRGATHVLILDGFDELLQTSSQNKFNYLEQVRRFQRGEAAQGRPVVVVVTSRTVVAHRVAVPAGSTILRIEPFDETRVERWVDRWNSGIEKRQAEVHALSNAALVRHRQLASQPLLLLMLALYAATAESNSSEALSYDNQSEFYESLVSEFVRREVRRRFPNETDLYIEQQVVGELDRLSYAAFGMFNRAQLAISEADLDRDLAVFSGGHGSRGRARPAEMTPGQLLLGRFFFIHESRATLSSVDAAPGTRFHQDSSFEFLHATFGEYLVARMIVRVIKEIHETYRAGSGLIDHTPDDRLLYAILSHQPVTSRGKMLEFLRDETVRLPNELRRSLAQLLSKMAGESLRRSNIGGAYDDYLPMISDLPTRLAAYSLNLVTACLVLQGGLLDCAKILPDGTLPVDGWRRLAEFWRSCLEDGLWRDVAEELVAIRVSETAVSLVLARELVDLQAEASDIKRGRLGNENSEFVVLRSRITPFMQIATRQGTAKDRSYKFASDEALQFLISAANAGSSRSGRSSTLYDIDYYLCIFAGFDLPQDQRAVFRRASISVGPRKARCNVGECPASRDW